VISVALYQTIQEWHGSGVGTREIARRLKIDVKTVRRHLRGTRRRTAPYPIENNYYLAQDDE
jgi:IS30 family transposase